MNRIPRFSVIKATAILSIFFAVMACDRKIDENGGYYDEKTKRYKYVKPSVKSITDSSMQVFTPRPGEAQNVKGIITRIGKDAKSLWIRIKDRKPYMILVQGLSNHNRNDKNKEFRISLQYVSPVGSANRGSKFREQWKNYAIQVLGKQTLGEPVFAEITYDEKARKFWATVHKVIHTKEGDRVRNLNLWMISEGLSFYFIDHGKSPKDKQFNAAQRAAIKKKSGIWRYQ
ncbi:MAG: hypothetical protein GY866_36210 [Proteobacteria bacterium]|nr:hypothetical protein [Pseudomonadota bacterium]